MEEEECTWSAPFLTRALTALLEVRRRRGIFWVGTQLPSSSPALPSAHLEEGEGEGEEGEGDLPQPVVVRDTHVVYLEEQGELVEVEGEGEKKEEEGEVVVVEGEGRRDEEEEEVETSCMNLESFLFISISSRPWDSLGQGHFYKEIVRDH